jgi:glyoxylase-like metal-dependent hydrolase (beta-lactamase superfamily II)
MGVLHLVHVKGNSFYCDGIFSVGVYRSGTKAILIDSGISKDVAKDIDQALQQSGLLPSAIIITHGHGDHCGGNAYFQNKYPQIQIYSTQIERPFIEDPLFAATLLCSACPFEEIRKFKPISPQQASLVTNVISPYQDQTITICDEQFQIITLPGHSRGMIGVKTIDNVLYCGDAVFGEEAFQKHPVIYYTCIEDALQSFKKFCSLLPSVENIVAYHRGVIQNASALIEAHEQRIRDTQQRIFDIVKEQPCSVEEITTKLLRENHIPQSLVSYVLTKVPVQAYLAELEREKRIQMKVVDGCCRAHAVPISTI